MEAYDFILSFHECPAIWAGVALKALLARTIYSVNFSEQVSSSNAAGSGYFIAIIFILLQPLVPFISI